MACDFSEDIILPMMASISSLFAQSGGKGVLMTFGFLQVSLAVAEVAWVAGVLSETLMVPLH